jgi:hypothetical protein
MPDEAGGGQEGMIPTRQFLHESREEFLIFVLGDEADG